MFKIGDKVIINMEGFIEEINVKKGDKVKIHLRFIREDIKNSPFEVGQGFAVVDEEILSKKNQ